MAIDVKNLIYEGESFHGLFSPSPALFPSPSPADAVIAELSILSSRREYWEAFVCLMGYAQQVEQDPGDVLESISFERVLTDPDNAWRDEPFFQYCSQFQTVPAEALIPATYSLELTKEQRDWETLQCTTQDLMRCREKHHPDQGKILQCVREAC